MIEITFDSIGVEDQQPRSGDATKVRNARQPGQPASSNHAKDGESQTLHAGIGRSIDQ